MKKLLFILVAIVSYSAIYCQTTTVTFKPDSITGRDAVICERGGCIPNGGTQLFENRNFGSSHEFRAVAWTWVAEGCNAGTDRSLLKFEELSTIPVSAEIISAELKLFGISSPASITSGNSSYPGSPYNNSSFPPGSPYNTTNESFIQRVTSFWDEQTVTWNTQPTTTTVNQISIPNTTLQWNWNYTNNSPDLVAMVQEMVSNPSTNFGFMLKLQNETHYRSVLFASSDHLNSALWPELTVTYKNCSTDTLVIIDTVYVQQPCPCEANFSYLVNTLDPSSYYFMASNPAVTYTWTVNGRVVSHANAFTYAFREGNYEVCYNIAMDSLVSKLCRKCINLCIAKEGNLPQDKGEEVIPYEEQIDVGSSMEDAKIEVFPNPTANGWTVRITTEKEEAIKLQLSDMAGKVVYSDNKTLSKGVSTFNINTNNLVSGNYALQIIGKTIQSSKILIKQ
jgi:hypothetical protein